jgi:hypothetical protein
MAHAAAEAGGTGVVEPVTPGKASQNLSSRFLATGSVNEVKRLFETGMDAEGVGGWVEARRGGSPPEVVNIPALVALPPKRDSSAL